MRATFGDVRVKKLGSVRRKAARNGWPLDEALAKCGDLVGGRIVCNNTEDTYRLVELLREVLPGGAQALDIQDQIREPNAGGYRALHVNFRLDVGGHPFAPELIGCEIQVRTRLQDAWAVLSHDDIYKQEELPEDLKARFGDLSEVLAAADRIASGIRRRVAQASAPSGGARSAFEISSDTVAAAYASAFGRRPADYIVQQALNLCEQLTINSLEPLVGILGDREFRAAVEEAYQSIMPVPLSADDVFLAAIRALGTDRKEAIKRIQTDAKREWDEIDKFARREALASLPATIEEFMAVLNASEADIESWADALGAVNECAICGTSIVDPGEFADAIIDHYGADEDIRDDIENVVRNSSVETGGWGDGTYCAYHSDRLDKD